MLRICIEGIISFLKENLIDAVVQSEAVGAMRETQ